MTSKEGGKWIIILLIFISGGIVAQEIRVGVKGGIGSIYKEKIRQYNLAAHVVYKLENALFSLNMTLGVTQIKTKNLFSTPLYLAFDFGKKIIVSPGIGVVYREDNHVGMLLNCSFSYVVKEKWFGFITFEGISEVWNDPTIVNYNSHGLISAKGRWVNDEAVTLWFNVGLVRSFSIAKKTLK